MSCSNFNNCKTQETNNMGFPSDADTLYAQKIYDDQTAANRCYANQPRSTNIVEGFGMGGFTWEKIIKIGIIILLVILFISLVCDYTSLKEVSIQQGGFGLTESNFELTAITELGEQNFI